MHVMLTKIKMIATFNGVNAKNRNKPITSNRTNIIFLLDILLQLNMPNIIGVNIIANINITQSAKGVRLTISTWKYITKKLNSSIVRKNP